jgi:hypothetical protein
VHPANLRQMAEWGLIQEANRQFFHPLSFELLIRSNANKNDFWLDLREVSNLGAGGVVFAEKDLETPEAHKRYMTIVERLCFVDMNREHLIQALPSNAGGYMVVSKTPDGIMASAGLFGNHEAVERYIRETLPNHKNVRVYSIDRLGRIVSKICWVATLPAQQQIEVHT